MSRFSDAWMDELLQKSDIASVVGEYCSLKPKGQRLWGLCPFHGEKTASFSVSQDRQLYYCFGCHAGGNVIHFVMEINRMTFPEAVEFLAQRAGMELPVPGDDAKLRRERARKERIYAACRAAARYYYGQLRSDAGKAARAYLADRGLSAQDVKRFGLGFAPQGWQNLLDELSKQGFTQEELIAAGLAQQGKRGQGSAYDTFRGRVMFPIIGTNNRVLGFGARAMGDEQPKYLNSADTLVFNKRNHLYALHRLNGKRVKDIVIVEGYMDVISLHKAGANNAVATLGTALTQAQARLMKRYVSQVYLCYDGDTAGQNATLRSMDVLKEQDLDIRVIRIPGALDPDDYVRAHGKDAFEALKDEAVNVPTFRLEHLAGEHDLATEDGREAYALKACAYVRTLQPVERERYYRLVARQTGIALTALMEQAAGAPAPKNSDGRFRHTRKKLVAAPKTERERLEGMLLARMAWDYETAMAVMDQVGPEFFRTPLHERLFTALLLAYAQNEKISLPALLLELDAEDAQQLAALFGAQHEVAPTPQEALDWLRAIRRLDKIEEINLLSAQAEREDLTPQARQELTKQIVKYTRELRGLQEPEGGRFGRKGSADTKN